MTNGRRILVAAVLLLVGGALACVGGPQKPSVEILSPPSGSQVALGEEVSVEYRATDATAVVRVELEVGGAVVGAQNSPVAEGQPVMNGVLKWTAYEAGNYTLIVRAYNKDRVASDPVGVSVTVGEGEAVPGSTVTISLLIHGSTQTPEGTQIPDSSATVPPVTATTTATRPATAPSPSPTSPPGAPTATPTRPAPTATRPAPTPTQTQPPPTATATTDLANLWVTNNSGVEICEIYICAAGAPAWGQNRLIGGTTIAPGEPALWQVNPGNKDLWAVDCSHSGLQSLYNVAVYGSYDWVIPPAAPPPATTGGIFLHNDSGQEVWYVYWRETGQTWDWNDDKLGTSVVPAGETFQWTGIAVGYYDLIAGGQGDNQLGYEEGIYVPPGDYYHWFVGW